MAVLQMQKINLCALKKNRKRILEMIQALGIVEVVSDEELMEGFEKMDTSAQKSQFEKTAAQVDHVCKSTFLRKKGCWILLPAENTWIQKPLTKQWRIKISICQLQMKSFSLRKRWLKIMQIF